jgi:sugar phosphate permease
VLTWISYASYYLGRKGISVAKKPITRALGADALVGVETAYLAAYAIGQYVNGYLGDRVGARRLVGFGMILSAACCAAFGASSIAIAFVVAYFVNGLAQSTGWPGNVKAMAEWTTPANRGRVMGVWATCYQVGGAVTNLLLAPLLVFGWRAVFFGPAVWLVLIAALVLLLLKPGPGLRRADAGAGAGAGTGAGTGTGAGAGADADAVAEAVMAAAARRQVLRNPAIWCYGASYFGIKIIRYAILFWLPFYLSTAYGYDDATAARMSTSFEVGGVFGTIGLGFLSDRYRHISRPLFSAVSLVLLAASLYLYVRVGASGMVLNFAVMALCGALLFGPDALISGAAAQDAGGPHAAAIAAGIVNGVGSMGAVLQEALTRGVSGRWGWDRLFYVFVALALWSAISLVPTFRTRKD